MGLLAPGDRPGYFKIPVKSQAKGSTVPVKTSGAFRACDQCGYAHDGEPITRAKHQVDVISGTLYFCNHHFEKHALAFIAANYTCVRI